MEQSAKSLRNTLRQTQAADAYLQLLNTLAVSCFSTGWSPDIANQLLEDLCANLGATYGFIGHLQTNTFSIFSSIGSTYPQAARLPVMGPLSGLLKVPCTFKIHVDLQSISPHSPQDTLHSIIFPIAYHGKPIGIVAVATPHASLTQAQQQLCETLSGLLGGLMAQPEASEARHADLSVIDCLTPREREVFALLPNGKSNAELAALLGIASGTVKIHVERILSKLSLKDRTQAAVKAVELGFSPSDI